MSKKPDKTLFFDIRKYFGLAKLIFYSCEYNGTIF